MMAGGGKLSMPTILPYICISYAWGDNSITNPVFDGPHLMSARTIGVLQTALHALPDAAAIWIYSFCLPPRGDPSRTNSLDRMGDIYEKASKVVVLSEESCSFLKLAKVGIPSQADMTHTPALEALEKDTWVTRAWTYQEITNSNDWSFVTEGHPLNTFVDGGSHR